MSCKDINFNAGYNGCSDKVAILKSETVRNDLSNYKEITNEDVDVNSYIYVDQDGEPSKIKLGDVITGEAVQSDWDQTDDTKFDYIKNKPELTLDEDLVSLYNVGGIKAGQIFEKGTSIFSIVKEILSTNNQESFYIGSVNSLSPSFNDMEEITLPLSVLISDGYRKELTLNNQYWALAIPKNSSVEVEDISVEGFSLGFSVLDLGQVWNIVVDGGLTRTTGTYTFNFKFKFK